MLLAPFVLLIFVSHQSAAPCADVSACKSAALDAQARKDYEAFHDLAWLAYRKGRPDDVELMLLLARAQSLSGRPSDALVMLQRIVARGIPTDAATSEDFARVRALPRWKEISGESSTPATTAPTTPGTDKPPDKPAVKPEKVDKPPDKPAEKAPGKPPDRPSGRRTNSDPLSFTTLLKPTALAYDAVSKRYLIADRSARRVAVIDENSGHVSTLVGNQAALGDISGIAIDSAQGDLWIVSAAPEATTLHRMQLISGRVLSTVRIVDLKAPLVGLTHVRGMGLVAGDTTGNIWRLSAAGRLDRLTELEYRPRAIASDAAGRLYVSAGGSKLARFVPSSRPGSREVLTLPQDGIVDGGVAIVGERLHFLAERDGTYEIRTIPLKR